MFLAIAAPDGGIFNHPALLQGDPGVTPELDNSINTTFLDYDSPTAESATWTETAPNVYKLNLAIKRGPKGDDGDTLLTPSDYGTPVAGRLLRVKADLSGFEYVAPPIGGRYLPASIAAVPTGNPAYTQCAVPVSAQPFDWYPDPRHQCVITGTGSDVRVDTFARLSTTGVVNAETAGPVVGRGFGGVGVNAAGLATVMTAARPPGSAGTYGKVLAGNTAIVYFRTERQAGANTFSTTPDTTIAEVRVDPAP